MINFAWNLSFADKCGNQEAFLERGFYPLNKNLLLRNDLRRTMTVTDKEQEDKLKILTPKKLSTAGEIQIFLMVGFYAPGIERQHTLLFCA